MQGIKNLMYKKTLVNDNTESIYAKHLTHFRVFQLQYIIIKRIELIIQFIIKRFVITYNF